jgi:hypothetical protein
LFLEDNKLLAVHIVASVYTAHPFPPNLGR